MSRKFLHVDGGGFAEIEQELARNNDDFDQFLDQHAEALQEAPHDEFVRLARMQRMEGAAADSPDAQPIKSTNINPPSSFQAILGGRASVNSGDQPKQVIAWTGNNKEVCPVTITLSPAGSVVLGGTVGWPYAYAIVQWGCDNAQHQALIDIGMGVQFTINASSVYVAVELQSIVSSATSYTLQASIGFYPCVRATRLVYSQRVDGVAAGGAASFLRPKFGNEIVAISATDTAAITGGNPIQMTVFSLGANSRRRGVLGIVTSGYLLSPSPLYLLPSNVGVDVLNEGSEAADIALTWGLSL